MHKKCYIIAEAGVNHNGSIELAKQLIDIAVQTGVDAIKFQTFTAANIVSKFAPKAKYQTHTTSKLETQYEMLQRLEFDAEAHKELMHYCQSLDLEFLSTPFDLESIELLNSLGLNTFKIGSGEITNLPYLRKIGRLGKKIILSTGMADLGEIEDALEVLETAGTKRDNIVILHCTTEYPTPICDVNLKAMQTIVTAFPGIGVGYSDHTLGIEIAIAAVALGAVAIEKHFTISRSLDGPDHQASLEPKELTNMVNAIRNVEKALGNGEKRPTESEVQNMVAVRKSIVASKDIKVGELLCTQNLAVKRPGNGISAMRWDEIIGKISRYDFKADEIIRL